MGEQTFPYPANVPVKTRVPDDGSVVTLVGDVLDFRPGTIPPVVDSVAVSGPTVVQEGNSAQFSAHVVGTGNPSQAVTWTASDGTISPAGVFTAPGKIEQVEQVEIKATSVEDPRVAGTMSVAIAHSGNTVTLAPSGGDDTAAVQTALKKLTPGEVLQMLVGTWNLSPIFGVVGARLLITATALLLDRPGYGKGDCMFTTADEMGIDGTGAFLRMPFSFAASMADGSEFRHAFRITGKNPTVSGISVSEAGGDSFYGINLVGGSLQTASGTKSFRNGCSLTDNVNGFLVASCVFRAQAGGDKIINCGIDVEANLTGAHDPCRVSIVSNQLLDHRGVPISNGLRLSLNNLVPSNPAVAVVVNKNVARNNAQDYRTVWPTPAGKPPGWSVTGSGNVDSNGPTPYPNN